ncbi:MAG: SMC family ATPase [Acidimicrobiia bacterium]|nr:SMC family ATPase [Acidimicrobiia bacterium]
MRPLELRLRNFRSYAGEHTFDFRDRTLVGIVGPIGSGKSSILDAIAFALYGRTPRIGSATKTLINQRAADAGIVLRFAVEGEVWEAARSIRRKGQSKHALYRYGTDELDVEPDEKLLMEGEVNEKIERLLGLDFPAFERSVLLAQGRFAEFLQARPADRDRVLKGVFGHDRVDRMKEAAKQRRERAERDLQKVAARLEGLEEIRVRHAENKVELKEATRRLGRLNKARKRLEELETTLGETDAVVTTAKERLAVLEEHAARLPDPETTARALDEVAAVEKRRTELADSLDQAQQRLASAEKELLKANESGEPEQIQRATRLLAAADPQLKAVVEADRRIASFAERLESSIGDVAEAEDALGAAEQQRDDALRRAVEAAKILEEAEAALEVGRHTDMAATLRSGLELEASCPVCNQTVHELPEATGESHVEELQAVVQTARETKRQIDLVHTNALAAMERGKEQLEGAREKKAAAETQVAGAREDAVRVRGDFEETTLQLEKILGPGDPAAHLDARRGTYEQLGLAREEAQRQADQARGLHDQSIRDEQESGKKLQDLGVRLAELAARLESDIIIGDDAASVAAAAVELRATWHKRTTDLQNEVEAGSKDLSQTRKALEQLLAKLDIDDDYRSTVAVVQDRIERLEDVLARDAESLERASEMEEEAAARTDEMEVFGRIARDLTDSRFIRFLLDEERARLAELGSEHFQQLSAGRYRFADDKFGILDLVAADVVRRADSLSGGETFLASLGLALALAEMVAGTGGRLDSFFLDEGFGTLDPEHLDLAMQGIEQLVAQDTDRLVVIVSHVPELRMRLEDLIELDRNTVTGDTRVVG